VKAGRIAVTGGCGFIGTAVMAALQAAERPGLAIDLAEARGAGAGAWQRLDIRDAAALSLALRQAQSTVLIHLAARPTVTAYGPEALEAESINVGGTLSALEACRTAGVERLVLASSAAVYGDVGSGAIPEDSAPAPRSAYGASKVAAEAYAGAYARAAGLQVTILRPATVFGPGQRATPEGAACAAFASCLAAGRQGTIFGDGLQTRDYVYVADAARAFVAAALAPRAGATYNVGTGRRVSIRDLHLGLAAAAGLPDAPTFGPERPGDIRHSLLDPSRIAAELGWRAETPWEDGLRATMAWARAKAGR